MTELKQNALQRRLSVALAGATSGARLLGSHAGSLFKPEEERNAIRKKALQQEAYSFTRKLGELKGAYVKIGQLMALYGDHFLPAEVSVALRELEQQTEAMHWSAIEPVLRTELGDQYPKLKVSKSALAAASLSQVHKATLEAEDLCLKVQYPGVASTIENDFNTVLQMLRLARWLPNGREFEDWMQDIRQTLLDEVDYQREAQMTQRVADLVAADARYKVPTIKSELCTETVLTMEFARGYKVTDSAVQRLSQVRRNALAKAMLENFFHEVFDWQLMQTDPNFGNYKVALRESKAAPDQLVLLDFGAVRELSKGFCTALQQTIIAAHHQDQAGIVEGAVALGCLQHHQSAAVKQSFADFCMLLVEPFRANHEHTPSFALTAKGIYDWEQSSLLKRVGKVGAKAIVIEGFTSPPKEFALIARKLSGVFSFIVALKAQFNAHEVLLPYLD